MAIEELDDDTIGKMMDKLKTETARRKREVKPAKPKGLSEKQKKILPLAVGITGIIILVVAGYATLAVFVGMFFGVFVGWAYFRKEDHIWSK